MKPIWSIFLVLMYFNRGIMSKPNDHHLHHSDDVHHGCKRSVLGCSSRPRGDIDDSLNALLSTFGLKLLGKDQESAQDETPSHDHSLPQLDTQAIINELFSPSTTPRSTTIARPTITSTETLPIKAHRIGLLDSPTDMVMANHVAQPVFDDASTRSGGVLGLAGPAYITETQYYLLRDEEAAGGGPVASRGAGQQGFNPGRKPVLPVTDTMRRLNFALVNDDGTDETSFSSDRNRVNGDGFSGNEETPQITMTFLPATPPPFLKNILLVPPAAESGKPKSNFQPGFTQPKVAVSSLTFKTRHSDVQPIRIRDNSIHQDVNDMNMKKNNNTDLTNLQEGIENTKLTTVRSETGTENENNDINDASPGDGEGDTTDRDRTGNISSGKISISSAVFDQPDLPPGAHHGHSHSAMHMLHSALMQVQHDSDAVAQADTTTTVNPLPKMKKRNGRNLRWKEKRKLRRKQKQLKRVKSRNNKKIAEERVSRGSNTIDSGGTKESTFGTFKCSEKGLFADIKTSCQRFFMCQANGRKTWFSCPAGTRFNQKHQVCDWPSHVNCVPT